jgi:DNA (cytosine-5)-methyltransferase 1
LAGLRLTDDPRNKLFLDFVDIVARIKPKVIVFENVEGLLSFQNGRTYMTIHNMFSEIGYVTEGRLLVTSEYAVPQKRKRVILICVREDLGIFPSILYPKKITEKLSSQLTARDTIYDLETVECGETACYHCEPTSDIGRFFRGELTYYEYIQNHTPSESRGEIGQTQNGQMYITL